MPDLKLSGSQWPTLEESQNLRKSKPKRYVDENIFENHIYSLFLFSLSDLQLKRQIKRSKPEETYDRQTFDICLDEDLSQR